jgi:hypothetical protein
LKIAFSINISTTSRFTTRPKSIKFQAISILMVKR